jgi:hypothetical protein
MVIDRIDSIRIISKKKKVIPEFCKVIYSNRNFYILSLRVNISLIKVLKVYFVNFLEISSWAYFRVLTVDSLWLRLRLCHNFNPANSEKPYRIKVKSVLTLRVIYFKSVNLETNPKK